MYSKRYTTPSNPKLWEKAQEEAKKKFRTYPSTYASLWASRWYKARGGSWLKDNGSVVSEKTDEPEKKNEPRVPLMEFEQYAEDDENKDVTGKSKSSESSQSAKDKMRFWLREPWVDISRPVIDEAGNVVGFHPCGSNTKEINDNMSSYRTSYPRCMPRSKAMRMNAIEREKMLQTNRYLQQAENSYTPSEESEYESE